MSSSSLLPETTDWLAAAQQQSWFDQFKCEGDAQPAGLKFAQFQEFLKATIYDYYARSCADTDHKLVSNNKLGGEQVVFTYQQEMILFKVFDLKNDHIIDRDEFAYLCQNWLEKTYRRACALVIVDVQNDFIDGSLALINGPANQDGAEVVPVINRLLERCPFDAIAYTQDWHPLDHIGFYENLHLRKYSLKRDTKDDPNNAANDQAAVTGTKKEEPGVGGNKTVDSNNEPTSMGENSKSHYKLKRLISNANLFDTVYFNEGRMEQKLWPAHCIQNSWGAELHPDLKVHPNAIRVFKGTLPHVDAYSAFWDNMRLNETGLRQELLSRKINDVFFCGLALDYCVAASAMDAAKAGFTTFVIEDACRGIDEQEMESRKNEMVENGIIIVNSETIINYLLQVHGVELKSCNNNSSKTDSGGLSVQDSSNEILKVNNSKTISVGGGSASEQDLSISPTTSSSSSSLASQRQHRGQANNIDQILLIDICFRRALALGRH